MQAAAAAEYGRQRRFEVGEESCMQTLQLLRAGSARACSSVDYLDVSLAPPAT